MKAKFYCLVEKYIIDCWIWDVLWCFSGGFVLSKYKTIPTLRFFAAVIYIVSTLACILQVVWFAKNNSKFLKKLFILFMLIVLIIDILYSIHVIILLI